MRSINIATKGKLNADGTIKTAVQIATEALENKKGIDVKVIPLSKNNGMAESLVIATGTSKTHVKSLADNVDRKFSKHGYTTHIEGIPENQWVLVDIGDVIVHVFMPDTRELYNLEKLWGYDIEEDIIEKDLTG